VDIVFSAWIYLIYIAVEALIFCNTLTHCINALIMHH